jgi:hypothetical protein
MSKLSKSIGIDLDVSKGQLDMTLSFTEDMSLDLNKIKQDNLENNSSYNSAKEQHKLAKYKLLLTEEKYDYYYDKFKRNSTIQEDFDDMLYDAQKDFDNVEYSYKEKLYDLEETLKSQYSSIKDLYESYENQKEELEDEKLAIEENRIKYQMGLISNTSLDSSITNLSKLENKLNTTIMNLKTQHLNLIQYSMD